MTTRAVFLLSFSLLLLPLAGCGKKSALDGPSGTVSGNVSHKKQALPVGTIQFYGKDGRFATGEIKDGNYKVENVPVGEVAITISVPNALTAPKGSPKPLKIPEKYGFRDRSGLSFTVSEGTQTRDFPLP